VLLAVLKAIAVLIAGPALAFGLLAIGCSGSDPALGVACGHNFIISLVGLTVAVRFVLIMGLSVRSAMKNNL
jgi:hypothetical protein